MHYRICIKGQLDLSWQEWFEDLQILPETSNTTVLYGSLPDQAALYRVLLKIRSLGIVLLSLETDDLPLNQEEESRPIQGENS
ncbi:hypothetical protein [Tengunoibacter tsumagoiensis]|uniref:Uncharacterized protein n=1 Tax=Tengunoibacter tsumagoiensis TaxID=2014871 RepID=A0A402A906_9CHLR|nr:hypothetical protein [Tengunoibacter tsumagoiensis]GCE15476.1 hypothetical protein KTT_53350 [Tengunoibacter tsumagoiensis]